MASQNTSSQTGEPRLKVFVSYSRQDVSFADQLVLALERLGFEPIIDRHNIETEVWRERLRDLIRRCDAVVFVLTDKSAKSAICAEEVRDAAALGKRCIPVLPEPVKESPPPELAEINYIYFYNEPMVPGSGFFDGLNRVERALRTDLDWVREHTRLTELADDWERAGQLDDMLLRGSALDVALNWLNETPEDAHVEPVVRQFINQSHDRELQRETVAKSRIYWVAAAVGVVFVLTIGLFGLAVYQAADAEDLRSDQFADASLELSDDDRHIQAMLMALAGDPAARRSLWSRLAFWREQRVSVRHALTRAYYGESFERSFNPPLDQDGYGSDVGRVVISSDGSLLAVPTETQEVHIYRFGEEVPFQSHILGDDLSYVFADFTPNADHLLVGGSSETIKIFQIGETEAVSEIALPETEWDGFGDFTATHIETFMLDEVLHAFIVTPEAGLVYNLSDLQSPDLKDVFPFNRPEAQDDGHFLFSGAVSPYGDYFLTGSSNGWLDLWESGSNQPVRSVRTTAGITFSVDFSYDGDFFGGVSGEIFSSGGTLAIWLTDPDEDESSEIPIVLRSGLGVPYSLFFLQEGYGFLTGHAEGLTIFWELIEANDNYVLNQRRFYRHTDDEDILSAYLTPDGHHIVSAHDEDVLVWRAGGLTPSASVTMPDGRERYMDIDASPDGDILAGVTGNGQIHIWQSGLVEPRIFRMGDGVFLSKVSVSANGQSVAVIDSDGRITLWDIPLGQPAWDLEDTGLRQAIFSKNGQNLITLRDTEITVRSVRDGSVISQHTIPSGNAVYMAQSGPDEFTYILSDFGRFPIDVWRTGEDEPLGQFTISGESSDAVRMILADDGMQMAAALRDGRIVTWSIDAPSSPQVIYQGTDYHSAIRFSPDGRLLISGHYNSASKVWVIGEDTPLMELGGLLGRVDDIVISRDNTHVWTLDGLRRLMEFNIESLAYGAGKDIAEAACQRLVERDQPAFSETTLERYRILSSINEHPCGFVPPSPEEDPVVP